MRHSQKNASHLEKCVTVTQLPQCYKNASQLGKCVTVRKMPHSQKKASQIEKCVTVRKMPHSQKNTSQLEKYVIVRKMRHSQINASQLEKCVTVRETRHGQKNAPLLVKCITVLSNVSPPTIVDLTQAFYQSHLEVRCCQPQVNVHFRRLPRSFGTSYHCNCARQDLQTFLRIQLRLFFLSDFSIVNEVRIFYITFLNCIIFFMVDLVQTLIFRDIKCKALLICNCKQRSISNKLLLIILLKMRQCQKYASQLEKCVTVTARNMRHSQKDASQLEKSVTDKKMRHSQENASQLEKYVTVRKIRHS